MPATADAMKQARDGQLTYGPRLPDREPVSVATRDHRGHSFVAVRGMGEVEYAPEGCQCAECAGRSGYKDGD